jgi:CRISPR-associated protein Csd1
LKAYAESRGLTIEPGFAPKSVRWAIWLDEGGQIIDVIDLRTEEGDRRFPQCPDLQQGELIAGGVTRSHFLVDTAEVVVSLGVEKLDAKSRQKAMAKHEHFTQLLEDAGTVCKVLAACGQFLRDDGQLRAARDRLSAAKAKPTEKVTFRVGEEFPVCSDSWHPWWREFRSQFRDDRGPTRDSCELMRCLQTGELVEPLKTHPKIKGLTAVGGQPSGCVLVGFDKDAFTSYGLEQSANAALSEEAATVYTSALNELVRQVDRPIAGTLLIYWYRATVAPEDDPLNWIKGITGEDSETEELEAIQRAKRLVQGINEGRRPDLAGASFHAAVISATGGRVMVRAWMEGTFVQITENALQWFSDLTICTKDGKKLAKDPGLAAIMFSLVRQDLSELAPSLVPELWRAALMGGAIPRVTLTAALQRIRADMVDPKQAPNHARMGLLKAYHVRRARIPGGEDALNPFLNEEHPSAAYQAGRLMAVLASVQRAALGDVGAGIVERYYAAASVTPALVLGRLVRLSKFHLSKLTKGMAVWYERIISGIMVQLGDGLPATLDPEGQSLFALGYYQQMAALYGGKRHGESEKDTGEVSSSE